MVRYATALLTVSAMLWHAIVGCCAHHVHAESVCSAAIHTQHEAVVADTQHGCCTHLHDVAAIATETETPQCPDHDSECSEAKCVFVNARSNDAISLAESWAQGSFLGTGATLIADGEVRAAQIHSLSLTSPGGVLMRRHLALGVLRI